MPPQRTDRILARTAASVFDITPPVDEKDVALLWRAFLRMGRQDGEIFRGDGSQVSGH